MKRPGLLAGLLAALLLAGPPASAGWRDALKKIGDAVDKAKEAGEVAGDAKTAVLGPDDEEERLIGGQAAATLLGAAPLLEDKGAQRYVNKVGRWLAANSERPELDWRFGILDTEHVGAFAAPGGYVFVTRGLLLELRDESELAGVLAHEITHVVEKHHLQTLKSQARMKLARRFSSDVRDMDRIADGARELYSRGLDRGDEYAADVAGAELARRAGYDPYALLAVLQTLDSLNPDDSRLALLFDTHPSPADRTARLDRALAGESDGGPDYARGARRYRKALAGL